MMDAILTEGFEVSAMEMFYLDKSTAEEFLELYKGIFAEFSMMVDHMTSGGPVIALEIRQENVVNNFRKLCGPHDPNEARSMAAHTLRA